jgi:hypothetical protein
MTDRQGFFWPSGLKIDMALTLMVPIFSVIFIVSGFEFNDVTFSIILTIAISYAASCVLDQTVKSRTVKIIIASVAALVSILLGYILVRGMIMVCDPVHTPPSGPPVMNYCLTDSHPPNYL